MNGGKSITIFPGKFKNREDAEHARGLRANAVVWEIVAYLKTQLDAVDWYAKGLGEVESLLEAWERGGQHGFFRIWEERRATIGANRPPPSTTDLFSRRMVTLLTVALERGQHGPRNRRAARKVAEHELRHSNLFESPPSHRTIERWQAEQPSLTPRDEQLVANAVATHGFDPHGLAAYFIGLGHLANNPAPKIVHD